jgi:c-di-GMP-binding flagellar brake protein YcgR
MKPRRVPASPTATEIFDRAVEERALAVLTLQDGQQWFTFKSRFLERDPKARFFVLDYQAEPGEPLPAIAPGQYIGVSFRQKSRKFLFATVVEAKGQFVIGERQTVPAIRYRWPDSLTELQRRAYFRTQVPPNVPLTATLWAGGVQAWARSGETALQAITGDVIDLSCGGALIRLHVPNPPAWAEGQTLGVELYLPDRRTPIRVDTRYRGSRPDENGAITTALQFIGLELAVDGRVVLERLAKSVEQLTRAAHSETRRGWSSKLRFR